MQSTHSNEIRTTGDLPVAIKSASPPFKRDLCLAIAALAGFASSAPVAANTVLFSDDFNRGSNTPLNGSTVPLVDPTLYPSGLTWASTGSGHNNTTAGQPETGGWNAVLPFTPVAGKQYLLEVVAGPTIQNALRIGFGKQSSGIGSYDWFQQNVNVHTAANIGQVNDYGNFMANTWASAPYTYTAGPDGINTISILLDTTSGLATATATLSVNGDTKGLWAANVSTYNVVGFGRGDGPNDPNGTQIRSISLSLLPDPTATSTTLASSLNPSILGQGVTFTATIDSGTGTTNPTGAVQFKVDGVNLDTPVAVSNGTGLTGTATSSSTGTLTTGDHTIVAIYSGDGTYGGSTSSPLTQTVTPGSTVTTTELESSLNPSMVGDSVTITATVKDAGVTATTASGTVEFKAGAVVLDTVAVSNGAANYSTSTLSVGDHAITATYSGDGTYAASSGGPLTQTVNMPPVPPNLLFSDDFNRGSNTPLNGSMVPLVNPTYYPSGLTWASTGSGHNHTTAGQPETGGWNAVLAFTPETGKQYLLEVVAGPTLQNALRIGFGKQNSGIGDYDWFQQNVNVHTAANIGQVNDYGNFIANTWTSTPYTYTAGPGGINTISILLDTTSGLTTAALTLTVNGETKGSWAADVSTYNVVGFGRGDGPNDPNGTQIRSISLSLAPELDPYNLWSGGVLFTDDLNHDGVKNGLAWLLGAADPSSSSCGLLPQASRTPAGKLVLKFLCLKPAKRGTAMLSVEYSNDLGLTDPWRDHQVAVPDTSLSSGGITFTIAESTPVSDYYEVTAEITETATSIAGKLFGRVSATP